MRTPITWLLEGPAHVQYRAYVDLLGRPSDDVIVTSARDLMLADPRLNALLADVAGWPGPPLKNHKDASHPLHKLAFLADLGVPADHPALTPVLQRILDRRSTEGPTQVLVNVPTHFGGSGKDEEAWFLCDAPITLHTLLAFGLRDDPGVRAAGRYLMGLARDNGWPCAVSARLGRFRGPGRKGDPCPYATLVMLKALSLVPEWGESPPARQGAAALLDLWERRKETKPYLFGMGTDFAKLKAPLIWYDLLHLLDVLTRFAWLRRDHRLLEMLDLLCSQADSEGRFTPGSIWMAWRDWDFGQKREPSPWITLLAHRILNRSEANLQGE